MKALITGSQGFVGGYLRRELEENGYEVIGLDRHPGERALQADLLDGEVLKSVISELMPDVVFHLAGQADVGRSWKIPRQTVEQNVIAAVNLMEAVRLARPKARMVIVGSSDQYGNLGAAGASVSEKLETHPQSPYAVSKKAQEEMAKVYVNAYGLNICLTRSFNHYGPGQREGFLVSDFASGIVRVERSLAPALTVGNLDSRRDYTHVKDVVRAYRLIAEKGHRGEIYNVGSGTTHSAKEILNELLSMAKCPVPVEQDPSKMRPSDTPVICCDCTKLYETTGWRPLCSLKQGLGDVLEDWRNKLRAN